MAIIGIVQLGNGAVLLIDPELLHGILGVDLFATVAFMVNGSLPARHVAPTAALPVVWIVVLS